MEPRDDPDAGRAKREAASGRKPAVVSAVRTMNERLRFEAEEWTDLTKRFRLREGTPASVAASVPCADLLDEDKCAAYMDRLKERMNAPSRLIAASMFAKRYAALVVMPCMYAMTAYDKSIDLAAGPAYLESSPEPGESWLSHVYLSRVAVGSPAPERRREWRDEALRGLYAGHLAPLWRAVSKAANAPLPILWENTAVRLFSLYEKRMGEGDGAVSHARDDFEYVVRGAPGALFGEAENPFSKFYGNAGADPNPPVRIRKTCCFYYKVSAAAEDYCSTCPKKKSR